MEVDGERYVPRHSETCGGRESRVEGERDVLRERDTRYLISL
jgi:hypothetical protein